MPHLPQIFFNQLPLIFFGITFSFLLLFCPGCFIWYKSKIGLKKILLTIISSIVINQYILILLGLGMKGETAHGLGILGLGMLWGMMLVYILIKNALLNKSPLQKVRINKKSLIILTALISIVTAISIVPRIDLLIDRSESFDTSIALSSVHDDIKHIAILNSIKENGILAPNPFFGEEELKYYISYYIIPAAISKVFGLSIFPVWFFWTLLTNILWILSIFLILKRLTKSAAISFVLVVFSFIMGGWDIIPTMYYQTYSYIEAWNSNIGRNIQMPTPYTYMIFLPQHIFAAIIYILLSFTLFFEKIKKHLSIYFITGIIIALITGNSVYIGAFSLITLITFLLFEKVSFKERAKHVIIMGIGFVITLLPLLTLFLGNEAGFRLSYPTLVALSSSPLLQVFLSATWGLLLDFGWLIIGGSLGILYFFRKPKEERPVFISYQIITFLVTLVLVHFISSKFYNDWGMKGALFITVSLTFLTAYYLRERPKHIIVFLPFMLIGTATFCLTIFQLWQPYIYFENNAYQALKYAENHSSEDTIIIGDKRFYNSLIPIIANRSTIVYSSSPESNAIAQQPLFLEYDQQLEKLFTTESLEEFNQVARVLNKHYIFIVKNTNANYGLFTISTEFKNIYDNNRYSLFRYQ